MNILTMIFGILGIGVTIAGIVILGMIFVALKKYLKRK